MRRTSLEQLLRDRIIRRIKLNHRLALGSLKRGQRDIDTAKTLYENGKYDWSLAISYNAMLQAGRALMFNLGYRPSSTEGHLAVVRFLHTLLGKEVNNKMIMVMNGIRKKRHRVVYEQMDVVSEGEAEQAIRWAEEFVSNVQKTIARRKNEQ